MNERIDVLTGKPHPSNGRVPVPARPCPTCGHGHNGGRSRRCNACECVDESMIWKYKERAHGAIYEYRAVEK